MKIKPDPNKESLTRKIVGINEEFRKKRLDVIEEKPLTLYLNDQEIVTMMTVSDYPKYLAVGYLLNQNMITKRTKIEKIDYVDDLNVVVVRTKKNRLSRKIEKKNCYIRLCSRNNIW